MNPRKKCIVHHFTHTWCDYEGPGIYIYIFFWGGGLLKWSSATRS
jgi:hypothetical protein